MCGVAPNGPKMNQVQALPLGDMSILAGLLVSAASGTRAVVRDLLNFVYRNDAFSIRSSQMAGVGRS